MKLDKLKLKEGGIALLFAVVGCVPFAIFTSFLTGLLGFRAGDVIVVVTYEDLGESFILILVAYFVARRDT